VITKAWLLGVAGMLAGASACWAQDGLERLFPASALRGRLVVTQSPEVMLNGTPDRLSPGARIRGKNNLLVVPASLAGQEQLVNYAREANGMIHDVWILTDSEARLPRAGLPVIGTRMPSPKSEATVQIDGKATLNPLPASSP